MSDPVAELVPKRPGICLNMIVKNEAHIVHELLDSVAPYISSWVIVDTGSEDGTQDVIRNHMARLGIPGELYERPWRNFGHNRTEAYNLAQGRGDYILLIDADDLLVGTPDFTRLSADVYSLRVRERNAYYWRTQLLRDGLRARCEGVIHEYPVWEDNPVVVHLEGEYHIESRRLGGRHLDGEAQRVVRDRDMLLAEVERDPEDALSVFYLAEGYRSLGDFVNAYKWYARRAEMGGYAEEVYLAMHGLAVSMDHLGVPWHDVEDALLRAWEFRPIRAESLYAIASRYREEQRYRLGYLFAGLAAEIPDPEQEILAVRKQIYAWGATDELAICAAGIGRHSEAFTLCRRLLVRPDVPDADRQRIAGNRDMCVPTMLEAAAPYPHEMVQRLITGAGDADVVVSLVAGPDRADTEHMLNSFLNCCTDVSRVGRFLLVDAGLSAQDRVLLQERYGFLEFADPCSHLRAQIDARFWLHLGQGWRFFAPEDFVTRLTAVLAAEPQVLQVGINFTDAVKLTGACAGEDAARRAPDTGRYVLADAVAGGPAMFDTGRLDGVGGVWGVDADPLAALGRRAATAGLRTASLDEVFCIAAV